MSSTTTGYLAVSFLVVVFFAAGLAADLAAGFAAALAGAFFAAGLAVAFAGALAAGLAAGFLAAVFFSAMKSPPFRVEWDNFHDPWMTIYHILWILHLLIPPIGVRPFLLYLSHILHYKAHTPKRSGM